MDMLSLTTCHSQTKGILEKLYKERPNLFYRLFMDEFAVRPLVILRDLYYELRLNELQEAGLLWGKEIGREIMCHGVGQFFPIRVRDKVVFMLTDWPNPYIKRIGKELLLKDVSFSDLVFPTFKFKEQFYYHVIRATIEIERLLQQKGKVTVLDFGTGAGAYLLYLAAYFKDKNVKLYGTEINKRALQFCKFNVVLNQLKGICISNIDILNATNQKNGETFNVGEFDIIIANPPYVPTPKEIEEEYPEWGKAGEDGLRVSLNLIRESHKLLKENGKLLMVAYSLGDEEIPWDILQKIAGMREEMAFYITEVYPPVWTGFNPLWRKENPIPVERLTLRFRRYSPEERGKNAAIANWLWNLHREGRDFLHHIFVEARKLKQKGDNRSVFFLRKLRIKDLPQMIECEKKSWPTYLQTSLENLAKRLETFPEGVWGTFALGENHKLTLVGLGTSQIVEFYPSTKGKGWTDITMNGDISKTHTPNGNTLHLVSGSVIPQFRRRGIWRNLILTRVSIAYFRNLRYVVLHSRIPGYRGGDVKQYASQHPYIKFISSLGFNIVDIIENCEDDPESRNYCVLMCREVGYGI